MIIPCPKCQRKNRIPERPRTDGVYRCKISTCGAYLHRHKNEHHDKLIRDVISDLKCIKENLRCKDSGQGLTETKKRLMC
jgi:hypothetical protein